MRKAAACAIAKVYRLDSSQHDSLIDCIKVLLEDSSTIVLGGAVSALFVSRLFLRDRNKVCPLRYDLIHHQFRRLCKLLPDTDEWGQMEILSLLLRYCRSCFTNPSVLYIEINFKNSPIDADLELLLKSCEKLLYSRNNGVVMAVAQVYFHLHPARMQPCAHALVREYHSSFVEERYFILLSIVTIATADPTLFGDSMCTFCIIEGEPLELASLKLEILSILANEANIRQVLAEFRYCIAAPTASKNPEQAIKATQILARICARIPSIADDSLTILIKSLGRSGISESVVAISKIIQIMPSALDSSVVRMLVGTLENVKEPIAISSVFYIVASFCRDEARGVALDTLRIGARGFKESCEGVKIAVLALAVRVYVAFCQGREEEEVIGETSERDIASRLFNYVLDLADCDSDYIVRDKARFWRALSKLDVVEKVVFARRRMVGSADWVVNMMIGSMSHAVNRELTGYVGLREWSEEVDPEYAMLRDDDMKNRESYAAPGSTSSIVTPRDSIAKPVISKPVKRMVSLDDFLADDSSSDSSPGEEEEVVETPTQLI